MSDPVVLDLPFTGRWRVENSPARRVPSHGTDLFGTTWAIDFVPVDERGRSAPVTWRTVLGAEATERFVGFGRPVLAPVAGTVVVAHDGEHDHVGRRSPLTLVPYALTQARRVRAGMDAVAGNHVVIRIGDHGPYVALVHLRRGSVTAKVADVVEAGRQVGQCGNSGNSTQPHVHVQVCDSVDWDFARGLPLAFRRAGAEPWVPAEGEIVEGG